MENQRQEHIQLEKFFKLKINEIAWKAGILPQLAQKFKLWRDVSCDFTQHYQGR